MPTPCLQIQRIPLKLINSNLAANGRIEVNHHRVTNLALTIAAHGLLHPITLRPSGTGYELIAGLHRLEAVRTLNWHDIPALVNAYDNNETSAIRLLENLMRAQLSPVEEAAQLADLVEADNNGVDKVALITNRTVPWILDRLDILTWPDLLQQAVHDGHIPLGAAKRIARIRDPETRDLRIQDAIRGGINTKTAALWLQDANATDQTIAPVSEKTSLEGIKAVFTMTMIECYMCQTQVEIQQCRNVSLCPTCLSTVSAALRQTQTPETQIIPPDFDPSREPPYTKSLPT